MLAVDVGRRVNGGYGVRGCFDPGLTVVCDGCAVLPELVDTSDAGRDDGRHLCQEFLLIEGAILQAQIEFGITIEQQDRHDHDSSPIMSDQRLPCLWTQCNRI
jgi:hypothetical protein